MISNEPLYKVSNLYLEAYEKMFSDSDLPVDAVKDTLEGIQEELKSKAINVAALIRNLEIDAACIEEVEKNAKERRKKLEKQVERLREYLLSNLEIVGINKIFTAELEIKIQKCPPSVHIEENTELDKRFIRTTIKIEPDKVKLKEALENGKEIEGVKLIQRNKMLIK